VSSPTTTRRPRAPQDAALAWPGDAAQRERVRSAAVAALLAAGAAARKGLVSGAGARFAARALALAADDRERLAALDLRARSLHAAIDGAAALAAYGEAIALAERLGDVAQVARLRAHAALLCMRYPGSFPDQAWVPVAHDLVVRGLAESGEDAGTFEVGALLITRAWLGRSAIPGLRDRAGALRDTQRALAIAERTGSALLRAHAVEAHTWIVLEDGLRDAAALGERLAADSARLRNRVEATEGLVVAAVCFARACRFDRAAEIAAEATRQAAAFSPHRRLHAAAAAANALAPPGRLAELHAATADVAAHAAGEGDRICASGIVALAGRALVLYEAGGTDELAEVLTLLDRYAGAATWTTLRTYGHPTAELLRPVLGPAATRRWIALSQRREEDAFSAIACLRAELPVALLDGDASELRQVVAAARAVAAPAGAPALGLIADWAEAAAAARGGAPGAIERVVAACDGLDRLGERYTAARLLADAVTAAPDDRGQLAPRAAARLEALGANASAAAL
jgi:hypothetical protein